MDEYKLAQGAAKPATAEDIDKYNSDEPGAVTAPDLLRKIDDDLSVLQPDQVKKDTYSLLVGGTNSYRNTTHYYHNEESTTSEIP